MHQPVPEVEWLAVPHGGAFTIRKTFRSGLKYGRQPSVAPVDAEGNCPGQRL
jgi:hypothetical protein